METAVKTQEEIIAELTFTLADMKDTALTRDAEVRDLTRRVQEIKREYDQERQAHRYLESIYEQLIDKLLEK